MFFSDYREEKWINTSIIIYKIDPKQKSQSSVVIIATRQALIAQVYMRIRMRKTSCSISEHELSSVTNGSSFLWSQIALI